MIKSRFLLSNIAFSVFLFLGKQGLEAQIFSVTNPLDTGPGNLKSVIQSVNALPGPHEIVFHTTNYRLDSSASLPAIRRDVTFNTPDFVHFAFHKELNGSADLIKKGSGTLTFMDTYLKGSLTVQEGIQILKGKEAAFSKIELQGGVLEIHHDTSLGESRISIGKATLRSVNNLKISNPIALESKASSVEVPTGFLTLSGPISGSGWLIKKGSGTLNLLGDNSYLGTTSVKEGKLYVNGRVGDVEIHKGATLSGNVVTSNLTSDGVIAPGNSLGKIHVTKDLKLRPNSDLHMQITAEQKSDLIQVDGNTSLDGRVLILPEKGEYSSNLSYTLLKSSNPIQGRFEEVVAPAQFEGSVSYDNNQVNYQLNQFISLMDLVDPKNRDNAAIAQALDDNIAPPSSERDGIVRELLNLRGTEAFGDALGQLQPAHFAALGLAQESNAMLIRANLFNRFQEILTLPCAEAAKTDKIWDFWIGPLGDFSKQKSTHTDKGYHANSLGTFFGFDKEYLNRLYVGFGGGYTFTNLNWQSGVGKGFINSYYGLAYALYKGSYWYVEGEFMGGYNHYHANRNIRFADVQSRATHSNSGYTLAGELGAGLLFTVSKVLIQPFWNVDYIYLYQTSFDEKGAGSLNLGVADKQVAIARSELGLSFSHCYTFSTVYIAPQLKLSWIYERQLETPDFHVHYLEDDLHFIVEGMKPQRSLLSPGIGFTSSFLEGSLNFNAFYNGEFGSNFWDQRVSVQIGYNW